MKQLLFLLLMLMMPLLTQGKTDEKKLLERIDYMIEPTLKSKACLKCLYFTKIISALCCYLEYFSYLYTIN